MVGKLTPLLGFVSSFSKISSTPLEHSPKPDSLVCSRRVLYFSWKDASLDAFFFTHGKQPP